MSDPIIDGLAFATAHDYQHAAECFQLAINQHPTEVAGYLNLGAMAWRLGDFQHATEALEQALQLAPQLPEAHINLAVMYAEYGQYNDAQHHLESAMDIAPCAYGYYNLGIIQRRLGNRPAALAAFDRALSYDPDWLTQLNRANELLTLGQFATGWDAYEARLGFTAVYDHYTVQTQGKPLWNGEFVEHLLIHYEQGFGDTIQSCRYLHAASERCNRLTFVPQPVLTRLLQSSFKHNKKITITDILPDDFDSYQWVDGLPRIFKAGIKRIPNQSYLSCPTDTTWRTRFESLQPFKVGVVWAGRADCINDHRRSMQLSDLDALLALTDISFVSLQLDRDERDRRMFDAAPYLSDWSDTAAAIDELDLVISVDTAVAHLAGAMGKPIWLLNRFDTCWRWQLNRSDSAWYPSMRIFRQPSTDDWRTVVIDVVVALKKQMKT
jgi:Tfp pilus assembly protein PilF